MFFLGLLSFILLSSSVFSSTGIKPDFDTIFEWTQLEFDYPSEYEREIDIQNGVFVPGKPAPIDLDVYYSKYKFGVKIFMTITRFQSGVPVALGTVTEKRINGNFVIKPYPDWSWQTDPTRCKRNRIVSAYRIKVDECDRLWVLDTGMLLTKIVCPPQILVFDLKTDRLLKRYEIPRDQYEVRSIFVTPVVEVLDCCKNTFVYIADAQAYAIVVYDMKRDISWRLVDKTMYPYPNYGTYTVQGDTFELMDGILGMSLSPATDGIGRKLFYHAMSSPTENWVYTYHLRNHSLSTSPQPSVYHTFAGMRQTQAAAEAVDRNGIMYFGLIGDVKIACFNSKKGDYGSWKSSDIIGDDPITMQFPSGVKVIQNKFNEDELWILTSRFHRVITKKLTTDEVNFRIIMANVKNVVTGSQCDATKFIEDIDLRTFRNPNSFFKAL